MSWWKADALDMDDSLNESIWSESPAVQQELLPPVVPSFGMVGAAQCFVGAPPLPWVPDLVGRRWREPGSVLVIGSSYADFFTRWCGRPQRMEERVYRAASSVRVFQKAFLDAVVFDDHAYYEPIATLLQRASIGQEHVVLSDLCRASFVRFDRKKNGDGGSTNCKEFVLRENDVMFMKYCEANRAWHNTRLRAGGFRVVAALGDLAASGVATWLEASGWRLDRQARPTTLAYHSPTGRIVHVLRVPHPSNRQSRTPADAADSLRALLNGEPVPVLRKVARPAYRSPSSALSPMDAAAALRAVALAPPASLATAHVGTAVLWAQMFVPAKPLAAAHVLALHPEARSRTASLVANPTAARIVAIANAMFNPCRPSHLAASGLAGSEEAWRILVARRDTPFDRSGTKWERLVAKLEPIPQSAVERLRGMDIVGLGQVAQALIRGPYKRA